MPFFFSLPALMILFYGGIRPVLDTFFFFLFLGYRLDTLSSFLIRSCRSFAAISLFFRFSFSSSSFHRMALFFIFVFAHRRIHSFLVPGLMSLCLYTYVSIARTKTRYMQDITLH